MKIVLTDREGPTAYLRFPPEHHHCIRHSNFIERTFGASPPISSTSRKSSNGGPTTANW